MSLHSAASAKTVDSSMDAMDGGRGYDRGRADCDQVGTVSWQKGAKLSQYLVSKLWLTNNVWVISPSWSSLEDPARPVSPACQFNLAESSVLYASVDVYL